MNLLKLFCLIDDFTQTLEQQRPQQPALPRTNNTRNRAVQMQPSEIMTLLILFHQRRYRDFKTFYTQHVRVHLHSTAPPPHL